MNDRFIYGKNERQNIVSIEVDGNELVIFQEKDGVVTTSRLPHHPWLLSDRSHGDWAPLEGNLHYNHIKIYESDYALYQDKGRLRRADLYQTWDPKEAQMQLRGFTYYKGMKPKDVSILSFDIEATTLEHTPDAKVLLISNTFRSGERVERKMFAYDEYPTQAAMMAAWCEWVRSKDPSIILAFNGYGYDLPYLAYCAGGDLHLGRDSSPVYFEDYEAKFRKGDGQFLSYHRANIFGREVVDAMFLAYRYDIGRKYENYKLKNIVAQEGLERADRQHYDASKIRDNYTIPEEWEKIKAYAEHDADDALALFDLMVPAYFYLTRSVPKPFQSMMTSASGSQINSFLVRSYLQDLHSIPKASEIEPYEGAISLGNPGIYRNVFKVDVASLYPSIILEYSVYDRGKDPKGHFLKMVEHFTAERLANKRRAKETGDTFYKDLSEAQKICINASYGMEGAPGLNFNSPENAAFVTEKGREILQKAMSWAYDNGLILVNGDTDSISIAPKMANEWWTGDKKQYVLSALNSISPSRIKWEDDGVYIRMLVLKAKNYALDDGKKVKIKGSALKATTKERALKEFIQRAITQLLGGNTDLAPLYNSYVKEIHTTQDISRWASKKSYTEAITNSPRENEAKIRRALANSEYRQGDKFYVYFTKDDELKLQEHWSNDHDTTRLLGKLHDTATIFSTVCDLTMCLDYTLKRNQNALSRLIDTK